MADAPGRARAAVTRLKLTNFRSWAALDLSLDPRPVCLFGPNGAGKTNLVEAVSFLGPGRGLRGAGADAVRRRDEDGPATIWAVYAEAETVDGPVSLATGADPDNPARRRTRLEGAAATQTELARLFPMLWLTPREDRLWAGPRSDRLRFFDRLVLAGEPGHAAAATAYEKAQRQRQRLLDRMEEGERADPDWLAALEAEMAANGVAMAAARLETLARLQAEIDARAASRFPKADLALEGAVEAMLAEGMKAGEAEDAFGRDLEAARRRDGAAGRALTGPHRTELTAVHREKARAASDCSTGEQKALLTGLALAQAAALATARGAAPVIILDEACAHLDETRREGLAEAIADLGGQAWLTGVERALFAPFGTGAQYVAIGDGKAEIVG
ncbi:DNA replication/repair protein RecF [Marinicauda salina]|uniref:DNA replication and repair protein RecF n=1 Tax=Marinicauda salina TaxID=2135793 RepID=A0A2U2BW94_9PROT|nr:DNA replication/repair protein RecF [Marinicauda salina]PWE18288.1 DNA replication/repair protein RecF [Marinicauda salina]